MPGSADAVLHATDTSYEVNFWRLAQCRSRVRITPVALARIGYPLTMRLLSGRAFLVCRPATPLENKNPLAGLRGYLAELLIEAGNGEDDNLCLP